jgi:hypothetical protein
MMACLTDPKMSVKHRSDYGPCGDFVVGEMARAVERLRPNDVMIISNWLNSYLSDINPKGEPSDVIILSSGIRLSPAQARMLFIRNLRDYAKKLNEKGVRLVLVVDVPMLAYEPKSCSEASKENVTCAPDSSVTQRMQVTLRDTLEAAAKGLPNVFVFDPTPFFLDNGRVRYRHSDGQFLFADKNHLSVSGSRLLADPFYDFLVRNKLTSGSP